MKGRAKYSICPFPIFNFRHNIAAFSDVLLVFEQFDAVAAVAYLLLSDAPILGSVAVGFSSPLTQTLHTKSQFKTLFDQSKSSDFSVVFTLNH